jgi:hypothetical protein
MKTLNYKASFFIIIILLLSGCNSSEIPKVEISNTETLPTQTPVLPEKALSKIDLTEIKHIAPKGRAQDGGLQDEEFNELPIVNDLLAHGKDSIPFLIDKLDDETEIDRHVINYWYRVYVGDIALIILNDFFTSEDGLSSTIQGFGWDEFLERGNDKDSTGEAILRKYILKHGRKKIKARWQKVWDENKENIYWDETCKCFQIKKSENK